MVPEENWRSPETSEMPPTEPSNLPEAVLDLLDSAGYPRARDSSISPAQKIAGALAWCIGAIGDFDVQYNVLIDEDVTPRDKMEAWKVIETALKHVGCPYPLQGHEFQNFEYNSLYPIVEWVVNHVVSKGPETYNGVELSLLVAIENRNRVKKELAAKLQANLFLKRQLGDIPTQSELIQYEHRFSELSRHIQEKHRQTRKYFATYNALLEIKELMLKETSLLSSINSQFQDAIMSTLGRTKLIDSMGGILKGTQQKLEKVQIGLQTEQQQCEVLTQKYNVAIAEQRQRSSLLKAFQEEYARNERLRSMSGR